MTYIDLMETSDTYGIMAICEYTEGKYELAKHYKQQSDLYKEKAREMSIYTGESND